MTVAGIPCAWWLVPEAGRHERLSRWIGTLAALHGGPVFEPHLTLALSTLPEGVDVPDVRARLAAAVAVPGRTGAADEGLQSLTLNTVGLGHDPHFFRAFHLRMAPSQVERQTLAGCWGRPGTPGRPPLHLM